MPRSHTARWLRAEEANLADLQALLLQATEPADCPAASHITQGVPVYDCAALRTVLREGGAAQRAALMAEWAWVWEEGPGILVLQGAVASAPTTGCGTRWRSCACWTRPCLRAITPTT